MQIEELKPGQLVYLVPPDVLAQWWEAAIFKEINQIVSSLVDPNIIAKARWTQLGICEVIGAAKELIPNEKSKSVSAVLWCPKYQGYLAYGACYVKLVNEVPLDKLNATK